MHGLHQVTMSCNEVPAGAVQRAPWRAFGAVEPLLQLEEKICLPIRNHDTAKHSQLHSVQP